MLILLRWGMLSESRILRIKGCTDFELQMNCSFLFVDFGLEINCLSTDFLLGVESYELNDGEDRTYENRIEIQRDHRKDNRSFF